MKVYTHEDVISMMNTFHTSIINRDLCMAKLTPIQINEISDEEIWAKANEIGKTTNSSIAAQYLYEGAKWYREQLKQL